MAPGQNVDVADLPPELKEDTSKASSLHSWQEALAAEVADALNRGEQNVLDARTKDFERVMIIKALQHTNGRRIEAANQLGMGRNTLTRKIQELGIDEWFCKSEFIRDLAECCKSEFIRDLATRFADKSALTVGFSSDISYEILVPVVQKTKP